MNHLSARAFDLLCVTVAVTLAAHALHMPLWMTAPLAALLLLRWWQRRRLGTRIPNWFKLPLVALLLLAIFSYWGTLFGRAPGSAFAVGLLVLKTLESEHIRDARSAMAFACFTLMSALLFDQDMLATGLVMLGLVPALACLRALEPHQPPPGWRPQWLPQLSVLALAAPLAILAFLFVPRLATPLWGSRAPENHTGLSPQMSLENLTELLIDDRVAMRVEFDGPPPPNRQRYFRAYVMWHYDGQAWGADFSRRMQDETLEVTQAIRYRIDIEPSGQRILPALDVVIAAPEGARLRPAHELFTRRIATQPERYEMRSAVRYRLQATLDPLGRERALDLPPDVNPRSRALAQEWRQRYGNDDAAIVNAALALVRDGGFSYTLAPAPLGRNRIDDFLFNVREGFCEHYAASFAFLMRAAGVPARVVTGFQGGDWNALGNYLLVRYSDAHAWDEVWLAGRGWVRVDPTAAVRPERVSLGAAAAAGDSAAWYQSGWRRALANRWDLVNRWWSDTVIGFNALRQRGLLTPLGIRQADVGHLTMALAAGCILLLLLASALVLRQPRAHDPLQRAQRDLERWLARHGIRRAPQEGPRDFFARAAATLPSVAGQLDALSARYLSLRYAQAVALPNEVAAYRRQVQEFRRHAVVK
ncbi:MAG TPA: DUF3488 and transglutaminase-like domain-containing protein [Rhodanobacteraceae bacterium]|nr:DUF3488 and transglutaminase-like domain-containing protein [Rhodanobacteraceae bacterium]